MSSRLQMVYFDRTLTSSRPARKSSPVPQDVLDRNTKLIAQNRQLREENEVLARSGLALVDFYAQKIEQARRNVVAAIHRGRDNLVMDADGALSEASLRVLVSLFVRLCIFVYLCASPS